MLRRTIALCLLVGATAAAQGPTTDVVVAKAEVRELPNTMTLVATVEPLTRSVIGSEIAGIVEEMPVRQGDRVEAARLLVRLNNDTLKWQLADAEAMLAAGESELTRWNFEVERIKRLHTQSQANDKEVHDTQASFDTGRSEVVARRARVERLRSDFTKTEIRAPFVGHIVRRLTEVGQWIDRGGQVVEIIDLSSVLVRVYVPESGIPYVKTDAPCTVFVDALKRSFSGKVWHIIPQADPAARTFPVEIIIDNKDAALAAGMFARATIIAGPIEQKVAVPKDAIVERDGVRYVGLILPGEKGKTGVLSPVTTGVDIGEWLAVTSGNVQAGTEIAIRGNERLLPIPTPVRIVDEIGNPVDPPPPPPTNVTQGHGQ